jgi:CO/xanthine dehydrogenase FAD-binding subunit
MRTVVSRLTMLSPRSPAEALRALRDDPGLVPVAGATDLYVALNAGTLAGDRFIDLWRLATLARITRRDGVLSIGALATFSQIVRSRHVQRRLPILIDAAREIGGAQIQNRGTIGGNVGNASPAGDTLPVLAVADAAVVLRSAGGERRVPFTAFYTGYRTTVRRPDELIVAIEIPPIGPERQWFRKVGTRAAQAISKVVMAGIRGERPRIALGSVAPTVVRATRTEAALAGGAGIDEGARVLAEEIQPIDDLRSTAQYRRAVAANLLRRFWTETGN